MNNLSETSFAEEFTGEASPGRPRALALNLDGYEGPIDVLLELARAQKVDLIQISILALAEQYLAFVTAAREENLQLAADYLVMAAWLAYLKSRLLLPLDPGDDEPSAQDLAAALQFHLQSLEAMRKAGQTLMERPLLGRAVFVRGMPGAVTAISRPQWEVTLYDLLRAYADHKWRQGAKSLEIAPLALYPVDEATRRLSRFLGAMPNWTVFERCLPAGLSNPLMRRSAVCAHFIASLELVKQGKMDLRQDGGHFAPIHIRARAGGSAQGADDASGAQG